MAARRFTILSSGFIALLTLGLANTQVQAQSTTAKIDGAYQGTYTCLQGAANLTLSLRSSGSTGLVGVFTFYLPPSSHAHPYSYSLRGTVEAPRDDSDCRRSGGKGRHRGAS